MNCKILYRNISAMGLSALLLASCSTQEKLSISAKPGTRLYSPDRPASLFATVPENGKVELRLPSDAYYGYFLAQEPGSDLVVPFGLDYKNTSVSGSQAAKYTGYTVSAIGVGGTLIGAIAMLAANSNEDEDNTSLFGLVTGASAGVAGVGAAVGMTAGARSEQLSYEYAFTYLSGQKAIQDVPMIPLRRLDPMKEDIAQAAAVKAKPRAKAVSGTTASDVEKTKGSTAKKRSDHAASVCGAYSGRGTLKSGKTVEEEYSDVEIVIERVDKTHVKVTFNENGEEFFEAPDTYEVTRKNGDYLLTIPGLPAATITITKRGKLTYSHKSVLLDDATYNLTATATRD